MHILKHPLTLGLFCLSLLWGYGCARSVPEQAGTDFAPRLETEAVESEIAAIQADLQGWEPVAVPDGPVQAEPGLAPDFIGPPVPPPPAQAGPAPKPPDPPPSDASQLLRLAKLYAHPDKAHPDYQAALASLNVYLDQVPSQAADPDIRYFHHLLTAIQERALRFSPRLETASIETELVQLNNMARNAQAPGRKAALFFKLALLYAHPDNPAPDYKQALESLEKAILFTPDHESQPDRRFLLGLLKAIQQKENQKQMLAWSLEEIRSQNQQTQSGFSKLRQQVEQLKTQNHQLEKQCQALEKALEKLEKQAQEPTVREQYW